MRVLATTELTNEGWNGKRSRLVILCSHNRIVSARALASSQIPHTSANDKHVVSGRCTTSKRSKTQRALYTGLLSEQLKRAHFYWFAPSGKQYLLEFVTIYFPWKYYTRINTSLLRLLELALDVLWLER
jgi:hypothetical protein